ncbi:EAL domain-containing protein [Alteromonas sp. C1M14]|uniref:EAL domain-containing protein n=1 Tax=Alteromonas sp. C1M14 TaxID=2841567 RepID=UPI001C0A04F1|nr:EAL domain-containing protein [Alteromonas sp. C1M14]MBU2977325.1 EAL domain-containing protein [Alteromonas sp. C1M14]
MPVREITESYTLDCIVPYFQPIVDMRTERVWRYECLARLVTPQQKIFMPSEFLHLIERNQNIHALAATMFCKSAAYFEDNNIAWNINLNAEDITDPRLLHTLLGQLVDYTNPSRVSVEISAEAALNHHCALKTFIDKSIESGMGVFIDNLGRHSGNIRKLMSLPLRGIKLDGGLLKRLSDSAEVEDFILGICDMAYESHISIVAEHIEDDDTLDKIRHLPIHYAQGFVFSKPKSAPLTH